MEIAIILVIIALIGGGIIGYKIGVHFINLENAVLHNQISLLQDYSQHWATQATDKQHLSQQIAHQQTTNLATTMQTVIQLMHSLQQEQAHKINREDQQKIEQIINQAKSITPMNE